MTQQPDKPIAYDAEGRPLYAQPQAPQTPQVPAQSQQQPIGQRSSHVTVAPDSAPGHNYEPHTRAQYANEPKVVHISRPNDIPPYDISPEVQQRHDDSKRRYPRLNLSTGEFVILDIKRHFIGLLAPLFAGGVVLLCLAVGLMIYPENTTGLSVPSYLEVLFVAVLLMLLVGIGTFVAVWVYLQNQFFLTNESVVQEIQTSLFSRREQMVSLGSIEDASFRQNGIFQTFLNYGTIRLSTEGDETTYRFAYVANPRDQVSILNNAIEAFKNGRPFNFEDDIN